jgi:hypothetical protein
MNTNIAAWCQFYWNHINPGAEKIYRKLSERVFSQVLCHEISACTWDPTLKIVTSPRGKSEMALLTEFEQLDWVKMLTQSGTSLANKQDVQNDCNVAFNFQDDFLVGTTHGNNTKSTLKETTAAASVTDVVEIQDDNNNVSVLTTKTTCDTQIDVNVGHRAASGSSPVVGPTTNSIQFEAAHGGLPDPANAGPTGGGAGGPDGK